MILELIILSLIFSIIGYGTYKIMKNNKNDQKNIKTNNKSNTSDLDIFDNLPIFNSTNSPYSHLNSIKINEDNFDTYKEIMKGDIDKENTEIENFNVSYFNFYDRINNTTSNYNNIVDNIHDRENIYKFNSLENDKKTIGELYDEITSKI